MRNGPGGHLRGAGAGAGADEYLDLSLLGLCGASAGCGGSLCELCRQSTFALSMGLLWNSPGLIPHLYTHTTAHYVHKECKLT